jgi:HAD superfamily 5'-nucleotidase-like hydrolase
LTPPGAVSTPAADKLSGMSRELSQAPPERGVFANRTLNLRAVQAIGYDMDYTLIHYRVDAWERAAFEHARAILARRGWPVEPLVFEPDQFTIGLVVDLELGNLLKASRFGYVSRSRHGNSMLPFDEQRRIYQDTVVELSQPRYEFMNTWFELSRASLWTQLVEIHDRESLDGVRSYADLYWAVDDALNETHNAGALKADIVADPERFVDLDPDIVATLTDQRAAGKQLLLITNSDWAYAQQMMQYCIDPFCPDGETWRDLFDVVIVSAAKPSFFAETNPIYRVVDEQQSLLRPHVGPLESGHVYFGGNARLVEQNLGESVGQPLYVGDHLFGDVHVAKDELRWRTALIVRELEDEILAAVGFADDQIMLEQLMAEKIEVDRRQARLRLEQRPSSKELARITEVAIELDRRIAPLAKAAANLGNPTWGPLMRAGNDKSLFARQVERYADVYTSRVSNLRYETPFAYLRAARGTLPHDDAGR